MVTKKGGYVTTHTLCLTGAFLAFTAPIVVHGETIIDLASYANQQGADGQGARFFNAQPQPTGTGVIRPFLTIQHNSTEKGYNTDADPQFDEKRSTQWNHALLASDLTQVTLDGVTYAQFLLDINESASGARPMLSMNKLQ